MDKSFKLWDSSEGDVIHPGDCMQQLLEQVRRHKVKIDGNVCTVIVTTLVLEVMPCFLPTSMFKSNTLTVLHMKPNARPGSTHISV